MLKAALAIFLIGCPVAWGQAQNNASGTDKIDRATTYYHYTMTVMYAKLAVAHRGVSSEYLKKAIEHREAAIKADAAMEQLLENYLNGAEVRLIRRLPVGENSRPK